MLLGWHLEKHLQLFMHRFRETHRVEVVADTERSPDKYVWPKIFTSKMKKGWLNEGRPKGMLWLRLTALKK